MAYQEEDLFGLKAVDIGEDDERYNALVKEFEKPAPKPPQLMAEGMASDQADIYTQPDKTIGPLERVRLESEARTGVETTIPGALGRLAGSVLFGGDERKMSAGRALSELAKGNWTVMTAGERGSSAAAMGMPVSGAPRLVPTAESFATAAPEEIDRKLLDAGLDPVEIGRAFDARMKWMADNGETADPRSVMADVVSERAENELRRRVHVSSRASAVLPSKGGNEKGFGYSFLGGGMMNLPYMGTYVLGQMTGTGPVLPFLASYDRRFEELAKPELGISPETGGLTTIRVGAGAEEAASKAATGALLETGIEMSGGVAVGAIGKYALSPLVKMVFPKTYAAVSKLGLETLRKNPYLRKFVKSWGNMSRVTQIQNYPGEVFEEYAQGVTDAVFQLTPDAPGGDVGDRFAKANERFGDEFVDILLTLAFIQGPQTVGAGVKAARYAQEESAAEREAAAWLKLAGLEDAEIKDVMADADARSVIEYVTGDAKRREEIAKRVTDRTARIAEELRKSNEWMEDGGGKEAVSRFVPPTPADMVPDETGTARYESSGVGIEYDAVNRRVAVTDTRTGRQAFVFGGEKPSDTFAQAFAVADAFDKEAQGRDAVNARKRDLLSKAIEARGVGGEYVIVYGPQQLLSAVTPKAREALTQKLAEGVSPQGFVDTDENGVSKTYFILDNIRTEKGEGAFAKTLNNIVEVATHEPVHVAQTSAKSAKVFSDLYAKADEGLKEEVIRYGIAKELGEGAVDGQIAELAASATDDADAEDAKENLRRKWFAEGTAYLTEGKLTDTTTGAQKLARRVRDMFGAGVGSVGDLRVLTERGMEKAKGQVRFVEVSQAEEGTYVPVSADVTSAESAPAPTVEQTAPSATNPEVITASSTEDKTNGFTHAEIAKSYLFEAGKGAMESVGYLFNALAGSFPNAQSRLREILNRYAAIIGSSNDNIRALVQQKEWEAIKTDLETAVREAYGSKADEAAAILSDVLANPTGMTVRQGKATLKRLDALAAVPASEQSVSREEETEIAATEDSTTEPPPVEETEVAGRTGVTQTSDGTMSYYHGGLVPGTTLSDIDLERPGTQQNKRASAMEYGGFYLTDDSSKSWSEKYARDRGSALHVLKLKPGSKIFATEENIDRVTAEERSKLKTAGYDMITGKDALRRSQSLLLNKEAVESFTETKPPVVVNETPAGEQQPALPSAEEKQAGPKAAQAEPASAVEAVQPPAPAAEPTPAPEKAPVGKTVVSWDTLNRRQKAIVSEIVENELALLKREKERTGGYGEPSAKTKQLIRQGIIERFYGEERDLLSAEQRAYADNGTPKGFSKETRPQAVKRIKDAFAAKEPVAAADIDKYGLKVPDTYALKDGEYVHTPVEISFNLRNLEGRITELKRRKTITEAIPSAGGEAQAIVIEDLANQISELEGELRSYKDFATRNTVARKQKKEATDAEAVRGDAGQVRGGRQEGQPEVQRGAGEGGRDLQRDEGGKEAPGGTKGQVAEKVPELMTPEELDAKVEKLEEAQPQQPIGIYSRHATMSPQEAGYVAGLADLALWKRFNPKADWAKEMTDRQIVATLSAMKDGSARMKGHDISIRNTMAKGGKVNAAAVDAYGIKLPDGYVREGDLYVFKPEPPTPPDDGGKKPSPPAREPEAQTRKPATESSDVSGREVLVSENEQEPKIVEKAEPGDKIEVELGGRTWKETVLKVFPDGTAEIDVFGRKYIPFGKYKILERKRKSTVAPVAKVPSYVSPPVEDVFTKAEIESLKKANLPDGWKTERIPYDRNFDSYATDTKGREWILSVRPSERTVTLKKGPDEYVFYVKPSAPPPDDGGKKSTTKPSVAPAIPKGARVVTAKLAAGVSYRGEFVKDNGDGTATLRAFGEKPATGLFRRYGIDKAGVQIAKDVTVPLASVKETEPAGDTAKLTPAQRAAVRRAAKAQETAMEAEIAAGESAGADAAGRLAAAEERRERARTDNEGTMFRVLRPDSEEFVAALEGTKATDKNGAPAVVYHGSPVPVGEIRDGRMFFTSSPSAAKDYTAHRGLWRSPSKTPSVIEAGLIMRNPLVIDALGTRNDNIPVPWAEWKPKVFGNLPSGAVSVEKAADEAEKRGHDGLIVRNVVDTADTTDRTKSDVYAVFKAEQVVIRDTGASPMFRVTPVQDAEYMAAVEAGDMEKAQSMVDEAAKRAGYNVGPVWHGSPSERGAFNVFSIGGHGFYFSPSKDIAARYAGKTSEPRRFFLRLSNPEKIPTQKESVAGFLGSAARLRSRILAAKEPGELWVSNAEWRVKNEAMRKGYDGFLLEDYFDYGKIVESPQYIVFDPSQIKSAEPVTRDDQGNVIPLSQRFNEATPDIRFRVDRADERFQQTEGAGNEQRSVAERFALPAITLPDSIQRKMQGGNRERLTEDLRGVHRQFQKDLGSQKTTEGADAEKYLLELREKETEAIEKYIAESGLPAEPDSFFRNHEAYKASLGEDDEGVMGTEHLIYVSPDEPGAVFKMNTMETHTSWLDYFNKLAIHNFLFPETAYELVGFARVKPAPSNFPVGWNPIPLRPIVKQAFVFGERPAQKEDMLQAMWDKGFELVGERSGTYESSRYPGISVSDLHDGNGVVKADGTTIIFDPMIRTTKDFGSVNFRVIPSGGYMLSLDLAEENRKQFATIRNLMDKPPEDYYKAKGEPDTPIVSPLVLTKDTLEEIAAATGAPVYTPARVSQASEVRDALADYSEDFVRSAMDRIVREGRPADSDETVAKIREFERRRLLDAEAAGIEMDAAVKSGNVGRQLALLDEKEALIRDLDTAAQALSLVGSERGRRLAFLKYGMDRNLSVIYRMRKIRKATGAPLTVEEYDKLTAQIAKDAAEIRKLNEGLERAVAEAEAEARKGAEREVRALMDKKVVEAFRKGAAAERSAFESLLSMSDITRSKLLDYAAERPDTDDVPFRVREGDKATGFPQALRDIARAAWANTKGLGWAPFGVEFLAKAKAAGFSADLADSYLYDFARRMGVPVLAKPAEKWKPAEPKMEAADPAKEASASKRRRKAVTAAVRLAVAENMLADGYKIAQIAAAKLSGEDGSATEWGYLTPYEVMAIATGYPVQPEVDTRDDLDKRAMMIRRHMIAQLRLEELNSLQYPSKMALPADKPDVTLRQLARELRDRMNDYTFPAGEEDTRLLNAQAALASRLGYAVEELRKAVDAGVPINEKAPRSVEETAQIADLRRTLKELRASYEALPAVQEIKEARDAERARRAANKRYHFWAKRAEDAKGGLFPETFKGTSAADRDAATAEYNAKAEAARKEYWALKKASPQERVRVMSEKVAKAEERLAELEAALSLPVAPDLRKPKAPEPAPASPEEAALAQTLAERRAAVERVRKAISERWREENADAIAAVKEAERFQFLVAKSAAIEDRIKRGDFAKPPSKPRVTSPRIMIEEGKVRAGLRALEERVEWEANAARGVGGQIQNARVMGREVYKFFKTAVDLSALGVQSARLFGASPLYGTRLVGESVLASRSDETSAVMQAAMHADPDYPRLYAAGLALDQNYEDIFGTGMGEGFFRKLEAKGEAGSENVAANIGLKFAGKFSSVALASQRAFELYSRQMRFHIAKSIINDPAHGTMTDEQVRAVCNMVNVMGGVGNTKFYYRDVASVMSRLMWSSRLFTAQWQTLTGGGGLLWNAGMARETSRKALGREWWQTAAPGALKLYARSLAGNVALSWLFGSVGMLLGDRQPWEDEETMFWKAFDFLFGRRVIGSKSIDTFGGMTAYTALLKRAYKSAMGLPNVSMSGRDLPDDGWRAWSQALANFARGRLRPDIALGLSVVFGKDVTGEPFGPRGGGEGMVNLLKEGAFPITPSEMFDTVGDMWTTHGVVGVTAGLVPALASDLFGFSKSSVPRAPDYEVNRHKAHMGQVRKALKVWRDERTPEAEKAYRKVADAYAYDIGVSETVDNLSAAARRAKAYADDKKNPADLRDKAAKDSAAWYAKARDILRAGER